MADKKVIYAKTSGKKDNKRYHWYPSSGNVYRTEGGIVFSPAETKIGSAKSLDDAISIIKNYQGNVSQVDVR